jgi:hypothetical protein
VLIRICVDRAWVAIDISYMKALAQLIIHDIETAHLLLITLNTKIEVMHDVEQSGCSFTAVYIC